MISPAGCLARGLQMANPYSILNTYGRHSYIRDPLTLDGEGAIQATRGLSRRTFHTCIRNTRMSGNSYTHPLRGANTLHRDLEETRPPRSVWRILEIGCGYIG